LILLRNCLALVLLLVLPTQLAAAPAQDWSRTAVRTPSGAFVQGNPAARVKLVEYLSLTCPHCALFEGEGIPPLTAKYIRTGLVSYEVRHALRDGFDFAGSMLARCDGPQHFFAVLPKVYAQQTVWFGRAQAWSQVEQADGLAPDQLLPKLARGAGFDAVFGMTTARLDACLASHDEQKLLTDMASAAWRLPAFPGTPAFAINGTLRADIRTWADLDAALAAALHLRSSPRKTARK
jgi:protein-disulfide isomerase